MSKHNSYQIEYWYRLVFLMTVIILLIFFIYLVSFQFTPDFNIPEMTILTLIFILMIVFGICGFFSDKIKRILFQHGKTKLELNIENKYKEQNSYEQSSEIVPNNQIRESSYDSDVNTFIIDSNVLIVNSIEHQKLERKSDKKLKEMWDKLEESDE